MNPRLTQSQQRTICAQLGRFKLKLLYKASIHGFTGAAFHQRCDNRSPTVSVGYNNSGFVFGGYTEQPFSQSGQYVNDDQAFLFTFDGENLIKYPVTNSTYANPCKTWNMCNCSCFCQRSHIRKNDFTTTTSSKMGKVLYFLVLYRKRKELIEYIKSYKPTVSSVTQPRVLLIGPVGAGKSSFFNSVSSVFRGHVTSQAISGSSSTSLTTQFRSYSVKDGREGKPLPIILCDTMGLEETKGAGLDIDDLSSILNGHLPERYQFNPSAPLHPEAHGYRTSPGLKDKIHCVAYVIDASKVSIMSTGLEEKLDAIRRKVNLMGIPQLVLLTKVDEACPLVKEDVRNVYKSGYIKDVEVGSRLGVPLSCVVPVKNYSEELELDMNCDILLLSAVLQMFRFVDDYFDELSDRMSIVTCS
uniref:Interferon-induced protein 44-like n=1 Tax=Neolamprologus brichardi TaxID=32507 RepID=A0A3Q4N6Y6_NEOBR